jgi:hypothetical protein
MKRLIPILLLLLLVPFVVAPQPQGAAISQTNTSNATVAPAGSITTYGGSFTTMLLNATTQTSRWKAYVGNVSGALKLQDAKNFTIYDWAATNFTGQVYASRNNSITWSNIKCINNTFLAIEESQLNTTTTLIDSINSTFNNTIHKSFYVDTVLISNSTCRAIATYINNTKQVANESALFQEVLLQDNQVVVYTSLLENKAAGYNNNNFDFQMIVAESATNPTPSPYYFWMELK